MTKIIFLPHEELCPEGQVFEAKPGTTILDACLANDIDLEHACEKSCACTTCHVIVREGFDSLSEATDDEEDMLDQAFFVEDNSRLGCQLKLSDEMNGLIVKLAPVGE